MQPSSLPPLLQVQPTGGDGAGGCSRLRPLQCRGPAGVRHRVGCALAAGAVSGTGRCRPAVGGLAARGSQGRRWGAPWHGAPLGGHQGLQGRPGRPRGLHRAAAAAGAGVVVGAQGLLVGRGLGVGVCNLRHVQVWDGRWRGGGEGRGWDRLRMRVSAQHDGRLDGHGVCAEQRLREEAGREAGVSEGHARTRCRQTSRRYWSAHHLHSRLKHLIVIIVLHRLEHARGQYQLGCGHATNFLLPLPSSARACTSASSSAH